MAAPRYVPTLTAAAFQQVKPTDSNNEYNSIVSAFNAIDLLQVATASMQVGAGTSRNILVDNTIALNTGNPIIIMMPASPTVSDPPVRIQLLNAGYATLNGHTATYIQGDTGAGDPIMGSLTILPRLYGAGDYIELLWVGGTTGWAIACLDIGTYAPVALSTTTGPAAIAIPEQNAFQGFDVIASAAAFGASLLLRNLPTNRGDRFGFTPVTGCSVAIGRAGGLDTVNGAASPQIFAVDHVHKQCVCTGTARYEVM
jgi:hypothetical protein